MKMLIDKIRLKLLLEEKRDFITRKTEGFDLLITGMLFLFSLLCSDYRSIWFLNSTAVTTLVAVVGGLIVAYAVFKIVRSSRLVYDHNTLYREIENLDEVLHRHSIVALKDTFLSFPNRFLLHYDKKWDCWFFFSFPTSEADNETYIKQSLSNILKIPTADINLQYITDRLQPKFSVKDNVHKVYQHSLYDCRLVDFADPLKSDSFEIDGISYKWMTIEEMENDPRIFDINNDVIQFVKEKIV